MRRSRARALLALAAPLAVAACGPGPAAAPPPAAPAAPRPVRVAAVVSAAWPRTAYATGTLAAWDTATVGPKVAGRVAALLGDRGDRVAAGQPVARLDATDAALEVTRAEAALAEARALVGLGPTPPSDGPDALPAPDDAALVRVARATLDEVRANHQRVVALRERGVATPAEFDAAEAALRGAQSRLDDALEEVGRRRALLAQRQAEVAIARQRLLETTILAPFDGVVLERLGAPGDVVAAGAGLLTIVRIDPLRLRAEVPERAAARVRPGQRARLAVEGVARPVEIVVARCSPALAEASRALVIEADVPNADHALRAGAFVRVEVEVDAAAEALVVPAAALRAFAGLDKALVVVAGAAGALEAQERRVTVGRRDADRAEVLAGLAEGDRVVLDPGGLPSGAPVLVQE